MKTVTQNANDLGRERLVKDLDSLVLVQGVILRNGSVLDLAAGAFANGFDIGQETHDKGLPIRFKLMIKSILSNWLGNSNDYSL
jgi:hypothetical protein